MSFPHSALRQKATLDRNDHRAMLAVAVARQANSRTARAMAMADATLDHQTDAKRDWTEQLIQYFASSDREERSPSGAFFPDFGAPVLDVESSESGVYQNASMNIKTHNLDDAGTGEQSNHAGHGASRTLC